MAHEPSAGRRGKGSVRNPEVNPTQTEANQMNADKRYISEEGEYSHAPQLSRLKRKR